MNYGGPIGSPAANALLAESAAQKADELDVDLLELRTRHDVGGPLIVVDRKITVLLELPDDVETLWSEQFSSKLRNQIRRPQKAGMKVRFGPQELDAFYRVFSRSMRDLGTPVLPKTLFTAIRERFPESAVFATVYSEDDPVAAGCGFRWRDEFEITWAGFLREYGRKAPNMLLYWALMERMIGERATRFNFGRCTPGSGTHRFKKQWGGADTPLPWLQRPRDGGSSPDYDRPLLRTASALWKKLPLAAATRIGPFFARRLP